MQELLEDPSRRAEAEGSLTRSRLERWRKVASGDSSERFNSVLNALGLAQCDDHELLRRLRPIDLSSGNEVPVWTATLGEIAGVLSQETSGFKNAATAPWSSLPVFTTDVVPV